MNFFSYICNINFHFMDIQNQKALIIEQFKKVDDINLINAIKSILDFASKKKADLDDIPEEYQKLVMDRLKKVRNNPELLLDWEKAKTQLKA